MSSKADFSKFQIINIQFDFIKGWHTLQLEKSSKERSKKQLALKWQRNNHRGWLLEPPPGLIRVNLTTKCLHLIVVHYYLSYSTTTTLQRTVVFSTTFLIYFVVAANCRYNYDDLLYTANMYYYATTYLS